MYRRNSVLLIVAVFGVMIVLTGCSTPTAKDAWTKVLKKCVINQTISEKNLVYMGPSNNVGVGAVWRKRSGGYNLSRTTDSIQPPFPSEIIKEGEWTTCDGKVNKSFELKANADVVLSQVGGAIGLGADLNKAKSVQVGVDKWRKIEIEEDAFIDWIDSLPPGNPYRKSVNREDRFVAYRAYHVQGLTAKFTFDSDTALEVKGNLQNPALNSSIGDLGVTIKPKWTRSDTLEITSPNDFYIVAELGEYLPGVGVGKEVGGERGSLKSIKVEADPSLGYKPEN